MVREDTKMSNSNILVSLKKTKWMEREHVNGVMAVHTWGSL
jgi:hypothetical protein